MSKDINYFILIILFFINYFQDVESVDNSNVCDSRWVILELNIISLHLLPQ